MCCMHIKNSGKMKTRMQLLLIGRNTNSKKILEYIFVIFHLFFKKDSIYLFSTEIQRAKQAGCGWGVAEGEGEVGSPPSRAPSQDPEIKPEPKADA